MTLKDTILRWLSLPDGGAEADLEKVHDGQRERVQRQAEALDRARQEIECADDPTSVDVDQILRESGLEPEEDDFSDLLGFGDESEA